MILMAIGIETDLDRSRVAWWLFVGWLGIVAAFVAYSFLGMIVLGVFGYYATRPINRRIRTVIDSRGLAAWATVLLMLLPLVIILLYAGFQIFQQAQQLLGSSAGSLPFNKLLGVLSTQQREALESALQNPQQFVSNPRQTIETMLQIGIGTASAIFGALFLLGLSITLAAFLLSNESKLSTAFRQLVGGEDTTAYAYAAAVDKDLGSVFFGNFLFVVAMAIFATVAYWVTNLVAPSGLAIPMILVLGFLTGIASLIPIIVGKLIYVPVVGYLALQALTHDGNQLVFVGGVLVVYFFVLDILPQTFLQPYITGRQIKPILMLFAYLLGPALFGWYGFFLLPILFILILETLRIVLPQLIHGKSVTAAVEMGESLGTTPREERPEVPDADGEEEEETGDDATDSAADSSA